MNLECFVRIVGFLTPVNGHCARSTVGTLQWIPNSMNNP
jgi:hypothetical protein